MVFLAQLLLYFLAFIPIRFLFKYQVNGEKYYLENKGKPLIIATNHFSKPDPFLLLFLPFKLIIRLTPVYFMTAELYYNNLFLKPFIKAFGGYPVNSKSLNQVLLFEKSLKILEGNKRLLVYPEGMVVKTKTKKNQVKPGVIYLAALADVDIIPLHIKKYRDKNKTGFILSFGKVFQLKQNKNRHISSKLEANRLLEEIYSLN